MAVKGVFASDQNIPGTEMGSFASAILQLYPTGSSPLLALTAGMRSSDIKSTVSTWFEKSHLSGYMNVTNNAGTGTTFNLSEENQVVAGTTMLVHSTGEYIFIDSITANVATVTRGFADTAIVSINGSVTPVPIQKITNVHSEGSPKPVAIANIGSPEFNYMEIVRNSWDATGTAKAVEYHTGSVVAENQREAGMFHAEDLERAFMWGRRTTGVLDGKPFRTMNGLTNQIRTNVQAQIANTTWDDIDAFLQNIFQTNIKGKPNERISFCGNTVLAVLNKIARLSSVMNIETGITEFGMKVSNWITPFGDLKLMTHPLMNENPVWTKDLYVFHPGSIRVEYLRRTFHDRNDKDGTRAGADADFGVYTTEATIVYEGEKTGGTYTGIDTAA